MQNVDTNSHFMKSFREPSENVCKTLRKPTFPNVTTVVTLEMYAKSIAVCWKAPGIRLEASEARKHGFLWFHGTCWEAPGVCLQIPGACWANLAGMYSLRKVSHAFSMSGHWRQCLDTENGRSQCLDIGAQCLDIDLIRTP